MKIKILLFCLFFSFFSPKTFSQDILGKYKSYILKGDFKKSKVLMQEELYKNEKLTSLQKIVLEFEIERLDRIKLDFTKDRNDIIRYIKKYIPDVSSKDITRWEKDNSLEYMILDGKKKYFKYAAPNLFRINKECKEIKNKYDNNNQTKKEELDLVKVITDILNEANSTKSKTIKPIRYQIDYAVSVDSNVVPEGEIIRCWLPFPKEIPNRQEEIKLINSFPDKYLLSENSDLYHSTIYFEQPARKGKTEFRISFQYTCSAFYANPDPDKIKPYKENDEDYIKYTSERPPHVVFTNEMKEISKKIINKETNPLLKAKKIFEYIDKNFPWTSAREYSTIPNLSRYIVETGHGDCGIQTLLFMTLARLNGIPTKWQSGWEPTTMHDWCQIYIEPFGWIPVDVTSQPYGVLESYDEKIRWFYLGNIENRRLYINDDFSALLYPAKIHPRSELVDFQRGEIEWRGGNLYFDKWDYEYEIKELK